MNHLLRRAEEALDANWGPGRSIAGRRLVIAETRSPRIASFAKAAVSQKYCSVRLLSCCFFALFTSSLAQGDPGRSGCAKTHKVNRGTGVEAHSRRHPRDSRQARNNREVSLSWACPARSW